MHLRKAIVCFLQALAFIALANSPVVYAQAAGGAAAADHLRLINRQCCRRQ